MKFLITPALVLAAFAAGCSSTKSSASMSPEEMQAAWTSYMTPGQNHKLLEPMVGTFRTTVKSRMSPDAPWEESTGSCTNRWIFDGRFLETSYQGSTAGMSFEGRGLTGYDNAAQEFVSFWSDSMSTGLMPISHGSVDATGKVFTYTREMDDPITGVHTKMREVTTVESSKSHRMEWYCHPDDGDEYHMMTIQFAR